MERPSHTPAFRLVEAGSRPSWLRGPQVLRDFTRVCEAVGIVDPDTGLIRSPQGDLASPAG